MTEAEIVKVIAGVEGNVIRFWVYDTTKTPNQLAYVLELEREKAVIAKGKKLSAHTKKALEPFGDERWRIEIPTK